MHSLARLPRRFLAALALPVLCLLLLTGSGPAAAGRILVISTSPVQPGKFLKMAEGARRHGLELESRFAEKLPSDTGPALFKGYDLVLFDTPRDHLQAFVESRLASALPGLHAPHLWLHEGQPRWQGLPDSVARRLHTYYVNGGRLNSDAFLASLAALLAGKSTAGIPDPIVFPKSGVYHPDHPGLVFADPTAYLRWRGSAPDAPVIAIALHQQYIAAEQTAFIDDLIRRIEKAGATALPFYSPVMDPDAVRRMLRANGRLLANALINTQIMLNPEGRRTEFAELGIPVVQAMPYRKGDEAAWAADPQGVALMDVPFYLAQAEYAGVTDIQIAAATRKSDDQIAPIAAQADAVVGKALRLARLQTRANKDKRVTLFFWNYPPGEKNLSASFMNLPRSLVATLTALKAHGYTTETPGETELTLSLQRLLAPYYQPAGDNSVLESLLRDDLAEHLPLTTYRRWLAGQPDSVRKQLHERWGEPERSSMVVIHRGQPGFVIPRLRLGHLALLPQPPRGERWEEKEKALYHSTSAAPSHFYMAAYLWAREQARSDAFIHYGTHGSQEWLPGKERGLAVSDFPMLAVGDVPVLYPYIVDNIGEATQAKRRGRATIISHLTPPFAPAGLHSALTGIHDQLHAWLTQDEGAVKDKIRSQFLAAVRKENIDKDLGWNEARIGKDFAGFVTEVHDHLHELARTAQPLGLHTFGQGAGEDGRIATVLMMVGKDFWEGVASPGEDAVELLVGDYTRLKESSPYRRLKAILQGTAEISALPPRARAAAEQAGKWYAALDASPEITALLAGLEGRHIPTSYGGDPIKNPDALPTGRNLYGFDPSRVPTRAAWAAGREAFDQLLATHRAKAGKTPQKLTFTLWSVETMRHFGLLEAQALWALGVEPVWDAGGRVDDVRLVPREALGRPRVDVVLSATGLYRDHFPNVMRLLAKAAKLAAEADEADNPVAANTRRIAASLRARGWTDAQATNAAQTRIFSSESGRYGTGLDDAALATDTWKGKAEGDRKLARLYLSRMQFGYGPDESQWGQSGAGGENLYAAHLKGTEGAVLSRSSNLYGMLTTDDPFQYLGGIALAVRHLDGKAPELYISNLRGQGGGKVEGAAGFLAKELATRNFHPGYIQGLMKEGYAGTLQVLDGINNFSGWQSVAREIVRDDQWQEFVDVYVRDKHRLGLKDWFERQNPHALAQSIERMLEAARQGYWKADRATVDELKARYRELARRHQVKTDNAALPTFVGFGLAQNTPQPSPLTPPPAAEAPSGEQAPEPAPAPPPPIQGMRLDRVEPPAPPVPAHAAWGLFLVAMASLGGMLRARSAFR
ncbi:MAG: cobaltochelatase subunit CobN [Zoogloea sp.]|uniref:cobaltochelatase subunit CobN n=1 Tax=Zoogloea sp. TaxID=49181 RepID=UPI0026318435|nr:cobaltochelatase subunit CobN [Zoogloea sp.]MDD2990078.1 cobaltochelatase subunit CobN [Zoogloea sp.]